MKITRNLFIWKIVTEKVTEIFSSGLFEVYALHEDDSESLVDDILKLKEFQEQGLEFGIEVGYFKIDEILRKSGRVAITWSYPDVVWCCSNLNVELSDKEIKKVLSNLADYHDADIGINWQVINENIERVLTER